MRDKPESKPPVANDETLNWEDAPVIREVFLAYCPEEHRQPIRDFGATIYSFLVESDLIEHRDVDHLLGVALDLQTLRLFLDMKLQEQQLDSIAMGMLRVWHDGIMELEHDILTTLDRFSPVNDDSPNKQG